MRVVAEQGLAYGGVPAATTAAMTTPAPITLDAFLRSVGRRAQVMAEIGTRDRDAALDIVQDSMLALATRYAHKPPAEWGPLFQTILQSRIMDFHRARTRRGRWMTWLAPSADDPEADPWADIPEVASSDPALLLERARDMETVSAALAALPLRQQQAFMLRVWEGLDTAATAAAMDCSEGSVKTHLSRAMHSMRARLEANDEQE
ncbi:MAG: polymerase sigma-70 factor, subfamily [Moraxellaceae bacterium]|jgi:RNA polymerase sigma-70 factor (ECF subfamily)|nr:polymerase sigma-70 factor, subfamily [Moraxellaceae bacterium]